MDTEAKIKKIFEKEAKKITAIFESINKNTNSYEFEQSFRKEMKRFEHEVLKILYRLMQIMF